MKKLPVIIILSFIYGVCSAKTYYVDKQTGNDENTGIHEFSAWQSIEKINSTEFYAGDSILFLRDGEWKGTIKPIGSGTKKNRIVIGAYGKGAPPIINAEGKKHEKDFMSASIYLYNQEYWEIRDIEIRNFEIGNPDELAKKAGILVLAKDIGTLHDFKFENLKIHKVNGSLKTRENGGIFFNVITDSIPENRMPSNFDGIYLNKCYFLEVDRSGFQSQSFWKNRDLNSQFGQVFSGSKLNNWYPSQNILIENCKFEDVGGNGLITRVAESPVVQHNLFVRCSSRTTGNASYPYNCNNALWQYNEACYTIYNEGDVDASGFDSDYLCKNTVIQYNYSHHNDWGGLLVCSWGLVEGSFNDGTIVRNNVFQDEKHHMIRFSGNISNTLICNNLFVVDKDIDDVMLWYKHWGEKWPDNTVLKENIFYNNGVEKFLLLGETSNNTMSKNTLVGSSFKDYSEFISIQDKREFMSEIKRLKKIGARKDLEISEAMQVSHIFWGD